MDKRTYPQTVSRIATPAPYERRSFTDAAEAVAELGRLYERNTEFLRQSFQALADGTAEHARFRAYYPEIGISTSSYSHVDSRLAYGHMPQPGYYSTTITRPDLFESYLTDQLR